MSYFLPVFIISIACVVIAAVYSIIKAVKRGGTKEKYKGNYMGEGAFIGMSFGALIGMTMDQKNGLTLGMSIGVPIGMCMGMLIPKK